MIPLPLLATAAPGLEPILAAECAELGLEVTAIEPGGVGIAPAADAVLRANLELRTASRVLVRVAEFQARLFPELERRARRIPWADFVSPGQPIRFRVTSRKSRLYHQGAIAERLAEVAGAALESLTPERDPEAEDSPSAGPLFVVRVVRDRFTISADSSGELLHRRGYRLATAKAPLRETLAAAMLQASGWDGRAPLADPFTGSGTIPIEAALLARRIPPGLERSFGFERWPSFDPARWRELLARARDRILPRAPGPIAGHDRDEGAIAAALANAGRAGVAGDVRFVAQALSALAPFPEPGHLVTNPPYGLRVGDRRSLRNLYAKLGAVAAERCAGSTLTVLLGAPEHLRALGLPLAERFRTRSGGVAVRCVSGPAGQAGSPAPA